jgi:hypothetical protein
LGGSDKEKNRPWLGYALEEALRCDLTSPKVVIAHLNAEVLVAQLPRQVVSELIARALGTGTFTPEHVLAVASSALLAEYIAPDLMWDCLSDAAEGAGLTKRGATRAAKARQWLGSILERALECELVTPADVLRFLPPTEFVGEAPRPVVAELIKNGLSLGSFDPALVLKHLTPAVIAEHLETSLVWNCLTEAATRQFSLGAPLGNMDDRTAVTPPPVVSKPAPAPQRAPAPAGTASVIDKGTPAAALGAKPKAAANGSASGRIDLAPPRPPSAAPPSKGDIAEWRTADDLDVLEEEPLLPARGRT